MSEIDEKRAAKNGIVTVNGLIKRITADAQQQDVEMMAVVWMERNGQIRVGYSTGMPLAYIGLVDVLRNDLLGDVLSMQTGDE